MHFPSYELRKTWLHKCLKSPVSENAEIFRAARLSYILFTLKEIKLEDVSLSDLLTVRTVY